MSRTNLQCLTTVLGWSDGSLDGCEERPLSVPLPVVIAAMSAAREDEREQIKRVIEKRITDYDNSVRKTGIATERWKRLIAIKDELQKLLNEIK